MQITTLCDWPGCGILAWLLKSCLNEPEAVTLESQRRTIRDELGYRTAGEDCWGRNIYQEIRTAAEAHRQTWLYMKDHIKPGYLRNHKKKLIPHVLYVAEDAYRPTPLFFFQLFKFLLASQLWWVLYRAISSFSTLGSLVQVLSPE